MIFWRASSGSRKIVAVSLPARSVPRVPSGFTEWVVIAQLYSMTTLPPVPHAIERRDDGILVEWDAAGHTWLYPARELQAGLSLRRVRRGDDRPAAAGSRGGPRPTCDRNPSHSSVPTDSRCGGATVTTPGSTASRGSSRPAAAPAVAGDWWGPATSGKIESYRYPRRSCRGRWAMVAGRKYWILIWYGILLLGSAGPVGFGLLGPADGMEERGRGAPRGRARSSFPSACSCCCTSPPARSGRPPARSSWWTRSSASSRPSCWAAAAIASEPPGDRGSTRSRSASPPNTSRSSEPVSGNTSSTTSPPHTS